VGSNKAGLQRAECWQLLGHCCRWPLAQPGTVNFQPSIEHHSLALGASSSTAAISAAAAAALGLPGAG